MEECPSCTELIKNPDYMTQREAKWYNIWGELWCEDCIKTFIDSTGQYCTKMVSDNRWPGKLPCFKELNDDGMCPDCVKRDEVIEGFKKYYEKKGGLKA
jgi:hypothetical protein